MARRPKNSDPEILRRKLIELFQGFETYLVNGTLREKLLALVPAFRTLRDLGCSLIPVNVAASGRERIIHYFQSYPNLIIKGDELLVVSGIQDYPRRIRELRVQFGWKIYSGVTIRELLQEESTVGLEVFTGMKPDEYVLTDVKQDRDAAFRWNTANTIRRGSGATRDKILKYLQENVGKQVSGEELRYVAGEKTEWARRVRELRTEYGWSIVSKQSGRPDLPVGTYILESLKQLPEHDRVIKDAVRCAVLERDHFQCVECGWNYTKANPADPRRNLELHHVNHHADGGENTEENLITLCNVCHDRKHAKEK